MDMIKRMIEQAEEKLKEPFGQIDKNEALRTRQVLDSWSEY